jgi:hypothetical protein
MSIRGMEWLAVGLGIASAACGSQASPEYYGESLGSAAGLVSNPHSVSASDARVVANWGQVGLMFGPATTYADVRGGFPASFELGFYEPPPESYLFTPADLIYADDGPSTDPRSFGGTRAELAAMRGEYYDFEHESRIAIAHVLAVRPDSQNQSSPGDILGADEKHAILYVESDIQPGSFGEAMFDGRPKAGYHIVDTEEVPADAVSAILKCQSGASDVEDWKACGIRSPLRLAGPGSELDVRLVEDSDALSFPSTAVQWTRIGAELPDPNAKPDCDPDNEMTPFVPDCQ